MSMRRIFIIRKDLNLSAGKLAAMIGHCCEAYWTNFLKNGIVHDMEYETLPVETDDDPNYWKKYRNQKVYEAAKAAHERGEKEFKFLAECPIKKYGLKQVIDKDIWDEYVNGIFTKTICEAKNLNQLKKVEFYINEINNDYSDDHYPIYLHEGQDYGWINDKCLTELKPENPDGTTTIGMWFRPLPDVVAKKISYKYKLYRD